MRRSTTALIAVIAAAIALPVDVSAQNRPSQRDRDGDQPAVVDEQGWNMNRLRMQQQVNAGPCPFVKVLYDAARYIEMPSFERPNAGEVGFTGEIQGVSAHCTYRGNDPITVSINILFDFGRGPAAQGDSRNYRYWVAVTERNTAVLAKEYFDLPVNFSGSDRARVEEQIRELVIPRAEATTSGGNFEILIGFDVTREMADFNRTGSRFRINAGQASGQQ